MFNIVTKNNNDCLLLYHFDLQCYILYCQSRIRNVIVRFFFISMYKLTSSNFDWADENDKQSAKKSDFCSKFAQVILTFYYPILISNRTYFHLLEYIILLKFWLKGFNWNFKWQQKKPLPRKQIYVSLILIILGNSSHADSEKYIPVRQACVLLIYSLTSTWSIFLKNNKIQLCMD